MAKRRRSTSKTTSKSTSNRLPPSVPKCVRKCADGYTTEFLTQSNNLDTAVKFIFKKTKSGYKPSVRTPDTYHVLKVTSNSSEQIDMSSDIRIAPQTRQLFSNLTTLSAAITATETWLGYKLPDIR